MPLTPYVIRVREYILELENTQKLIHSITTMIQLSKELSESPGPSITYSLL